MTMLPSGRHVLSALLKALLLTHTALGSNRCWKSDLHWDTPNIFFLHTKKA